MEQSNLSVISFDYQIDFYTNKANIPNQALVTETINWFENGDGARAFTSLQFLNLLWKQYGFIVDNIDHTDALIVHFQELPLSGLEKHILYGLIIKWFGGYPLDAPLGIDKSQLFYDFRKCLLELFLGYPEETPEKEFCKRNQDQLNRMVKMEIAMNTAIRNNIPVKEVWNILTGSKPGEEQFHDFAALFRAACQANLLGKQSEGNSYLANESLHNYQFTVWLQDEKQLQHGNSEQYGQLLTLSNFAAYLQAQKQEQQSVDFLNSIPGEKVFWIFTEQHNRLRERFRVKRIATAQDCLRIPRLKEGDILSFEPAYETTAQAFTLLTEYYAGTCLELEKHLFISKYKISNPETIRAEITELEKFIERAKAVNLSDACDAYGKWGEDRPEFVYKRFLCGFYEHLEIESYPGIATIGNIEASVYGRYFLFYEFLQQELGKPAGIAEFIELLNTSDELAKKDLDNGFYKLEEYIKNEIYENVHTDEPRLRQIRRNLLTWRNQLENDFIDPEKQSLRNSPYFNERKQNAERMQGKIDAALKLIDLRIEDKASVSEKKAHISAEASTIANHMVMAKDAFSSEADFLEAVRMIEHFFSGTYIKPDKTIFVKKKNIKSLAYCLGEIWRSRSNDIITHAYLQFYIDTFSIFSKQKLDAGNVFSNNLYKYSISKT